MLTTRGVGAGCACVRCAARQGRARLADVPFRLPRDVRALSALGIGERFGLGAGPGDEASDDVHGELDWVEHGFSLPATSHRASEEGNCHSWMSEAKRVSGPLHESRLRVGASAIQVGASRSPLVVPAVLRTNPLSSVLHRQGCRRRARALPSRRLRRVGRRPSTNSGYRRPSPRLTPLAGRSGAASLEDAGGEAAQGFRFARPDGP